MSDPAVESESTEASIDPAAPNGSTAGLVFTCFLVGLFCLGLGFYFCALQDLYYTHYQPFFDSLSYYDQMHTVMLTGQQQGIAASIYHAVDSGSTVVMPFLLVSLISTLVEPTRNIGVWIQTVEIGLLMMSALYYFHRVKKISPWPALILVVPFVLTTCLYRNNGGMSDFRMDLSLYLTYSISCIWYLIAVSTGRKWHFVVVGLAIAVTCLFRGTAPVYLVLGLGPIALVEVALVRRRESIVGLAIALATAVAGSLWFFILKFDKLYYYYFVWNLDANAKLPISESAGHIKFAIKHIGDHFLIWIVCVNVFLLLANWKRGRSLFQTASALIVKSTRETDLRLVWLALAPLAMLVLRGAGLNPYVCMPAITGILLWVLNPIAANQAFFESRSALVAAALTSIICLGLLANEGWERHGPGEYNSMVAHKQMIRTIVNDAKLEGVQHVNYGSTHVFYLNSSSLRSAIRFDIPDATFEDGQGFVDNVQMSPSNVFSKVVVDVTWNEIEGTGNEKLDNLISQANDQIDYLIVPDAATIRYLEENIQFNVINQHQTYLREYFTKSDRWALVGAPIKNGEDETVQLYANLRRTH